MSDASLAPTEARDTVSASERVEEVKQENNLLRVGTEDLPRSVSMDSVGSPGVQISPNPDSRRPRVSLSSKKTGGLSTQQAKKILNEEIEMVIHDIDVQTGNVLQLILKAIWNMLLLNKTSPLLRDSKSSKFLVVALYLSSITLSVFFLLFGAMLIVASILKWLQVIPNKLIQGEHVRVLVEAIIFVLILVIYLIANIVRNWREKKIKVSLLKAKYEQFKKCGYDFPTTGNLLGIESMPFIAACRDGQWIKLPMVLLVKGDLVYSNSPNEIDFYEMKYNKTDVEGFYTVQETLIARNIRQTLEPYTKYGNIESPIYAFFITMFTIFIIITFLLTLVVNIIRVTVPLGDYDPFHLLLLQPIYVNIFLLPFSYPMVWVLVNSYGNTRLLSLFLYLSDVANAEDEAKKKNLLEITSSNRESQVSVPFSYFLRHMFDRAFANFIKSNPYKDLMTIGRVTVLDCVDKDGVLSHVHYVPEKLLFLTSKPPESTSILPAPMMEEYQQADAQSAAKQDEEAMNTVSHQEIQEASIEITLPQNPEEENAQSLASISAENDITNRSQQQAPQIDDNPTEPLPSEVEEPRSASFASPIPIEEKRTACPEIVDIMFEKDSGSTEGSIRFQDEDWSNHMNSLKPLGLNFLINSSDIFDDEASKSENQDGSFFMMRNDFSPLWRKYIMQLGKTIGFDDNILNRFNFLKRIYTRRKAKEMSAVIVDYDNLMQIHSHGHPQLVLEYCSDYWDGSDLRMLTPEARSEIIKTFTQWSERSAYYCVALAYNNIDPKFTEFIRENMDNSESVLYLEDSTQSRSNEYMQVQRNQIFLGMVALIKPHKSYMQEFINEHSHDAGIRFIYLSSHNSQRTKAFGKKLGLETDWNSCISLTNRDDIKLDESDIKAHLPHGIENIKAHIREVDNVPLLVSLFSDCTSSTAKQMIRIQQDYKEVVCVVGSSTCVENLEMFAQGNIAIAVDPSSAEEDVIQSNQGDTNKIKKMVAGYEAFTKLISFPCALHITGDASEYTYQIIFQLIKEGRRMLANVNQSFAYFISASTCLYAIAILSMLLMIPPIMNGIQALWMLLIIIPILSFSFMTNPRAPNDMQSVMEKNNFESKKYVLLLIHNIFRFAITVPVAIVTYVAVLATFGHATWANVWGGQIPISGSGHIFNTARFQGEMLIAQSVTHFSIVIHFVILSVMYISDIHSIFVVWPIKNWVWMILCFVVLALQIIFSSLSCVFFAPGIMLPAIPFYVYLIVFIPPFVIILADELVKLKMRKIYCTDQQRAKLIFDTRLGMYSPK